jgi:hypothetical protein
MGMAATTPAPSPPPRSPTSTSRTSRPLHPRRLRRPSPTRPRLIPLHQRPPRLHRQRRRRQGGRRRSGRGLLHRHRRLVRPRRRTARPRRGTAQPPQLSNRHQLGSRPRPLPRAWPRGSTGPSSPDRMVRPPFRASRTHQGRDRLFRQCRTSRSPARSNQRRRSRQRNPTATGTESTRHRGTTSTTRSRTPSGTATYPGICPTHTTRTGQFPTAEPGRATAVAWQTLPVREWGDESGVATG